MRPRIVAHVVSTTHRLAFSCPAPQSSQTALLYKLNDGLLTSVQDAIAAGAEAQASVVVDLGGFRFTGSLKGSLLQPKCKVTLQNGTLELPGNSYVSLSCFLYVCVCACVRACVCGCGCRKECTSTHTHTLT
jgi:hypothetical protein